MASSKPTGAHTSNTSKICISSYVVMALSGLMGGGSLILFGVFLYVGLPNQMDFGLHEQTNLYIDTLLCFLFFLQHSLMTRKGFRDWLTGFISPNFLGSFFSISSGLFLVILMLFWQKSTSVLYELDGALYWLMRILFFLFIIGFYLTVRSLRLFDPLGIRAIFAHTMGKPARGPIFIVRGTYRWVRHPLYFLSLMMIWADVSMTTDRLLFNALWTVWIITGTFLEEKDLIASFGDEYRKYQRQVPMLIPHRWRPWSHNKK